MWAEGRLSHRSQRMKVILKICNLLMRGAERHGMVGNRGGDGGEWQSESCSAKTRVPTECRMARSESNLDLRRLGNPGERLEVWDTAAPERVKEARRGT